MTRGEAIDNNKNLRMYMRLSDKNQPYKFLEENYIALDMAIKALEHPEKNVVSIVPCGNAISRYDAIHLADELKQDLPDDEHLTDMVMAHNEGISEYQTQLSLLPPVNPQNCDTCEVGNPCLYCKHEFEQRKRSE